MTEVISNKKYENMKDIIELSNKLSKQLNETVVIINYKLLKVEE